MSDDLFERLLSKGYLPESLPPIFSTNSFANFAIKNPDAFKDVSKQPSRLRGTDYSASKSGYRRRTFVVVHPVPQYFVSEFVSNHWAALEEQLKKSSFSASTPSLSSADSPRAVEITPFNELHQIIHKQLGQYAFVARSDIQLFYPSIYTHSIPWAFHGKKASKQDANPDSKNVYFNKLDQCIRRGQDGQTIGIPIGPDSSRIIAELIGTAIDERLKELAGGNLLDCVRHVDDIYMGADTEEAAASCISAFRRALREFGLGCVDKMIDA